MGFLSKFFGRKAKEDEFVGGSFTTRLGKQVPTDKVFDAWTSDDLNKMLNVIDVETNLIERHFLLQSIIKKAKSNAQHSKVASRLRGWTASQPQLAGLCTWATELV